MDKKNTALKVVISLYFLVLTIILPGCGTAIDTSDKQKVIDINHAVEEQRSALSIENYAEQYPKALQLIEDEKYFEAMAILRNLADYQDGRKLYNIALRKQNRISTGDEHVLGLKSDGTVLASGFKNLYGECNVDGIDSYENIIEEKNDVYGIKKDGSRVFLGLKEFYDYNNFANKPKWENMSAVSAGRSFSAGVKSDGTVEVIGASMPDVSEWDNIIDFSGRSSELDYCIGLRSDGTIVGDNNWITDKWWEEWNEIVSISSGSGFILGLKKDGTVVAYGDNEYGQCNVGDWTNIVAIAAGGAFSVGLRCDGTVIATGLNNSGQCDLENWKDVVVISACGAITNGIKSDGTVVSTSFEIEEWKDIVAITEVNHKGWMHCIGLKSDGTLVYTGDKTGMKILSEMGLESWDLW